jgi:hypothetical protein
MSDFFKVKIVYSQSHTVFPKIIFVILIIFAVILLIQSLMKAKKENRSFLDFKGKKFFIEKYDKLKFYGTIVLLILYILSLNLLGFLPASIIFISLFNILYAGKKEPKSIAISIGISIVESLLIWFVFGYLFEVTLP